MLKVVPMYFLSKYKTAIINFQHYAYFKTYKQRNSKMSGKFTTSNLKMQEIRFEMVLTQ